jgi:hypothetical protein
MEDHMNVDLKRLLLLGTFAIVGLGLFYPASASAQQVGTYVGTTADKNYIAIYVGKGTQAGKFEITALSLNFTATCANNGNKVSENWYSGLSQGIVGGKASLVATVDDSVYITASLVFSGKTTVKGTVRSIAAAFVQGKTPPVAAEFCVSKSQSFSATFQANPQATAPSSQGAVFYDSAGHPIARTAPVAP